MRLLFQLYLSLLGALRQPLGRLWPWHVPLLSAGWLLIQLYSLWQHQGPHISVDSNRFLEYGQEIVTTGTFADTHILRYVGYPLFLSFWLKLRLGLWGIVVGQIMLSGLALWALYDGVRRVAHGARLPAFLAAGATALWFDIQHFNTSILTESVFTSFILLAFWAFVWASSRPTPGRWLLCTLLLLLAGISRPNAFLVPTVGLVACVVQLKQRFRWPLSNIVLIGLICLLPAVWFLLNKLLVTFRLIETYQRGDIIFGYWGLVVKPAGPLVLPPAHWEPLARLGFFILHNPTHFAKLAGLKLLVWFSSVKPYYSMLHNIACVAFLYPCYYLAWRGLRRVDIAVPVRVFAGLLFAGQGFVVMMTVEDWDVRFLAPVLPCIFILAALEAHLIVSHKQISWPASYSQT